jgi:hypothetical protein
MAIARAKVETILDREAERSAVTRLGAPATEVNLDKIHISSRPDEESPQVLYRQGHSAG